MLNIVSRSTSGNGWGGMVKVFRNLTAGLDRLRYPYVVNKALDACPYLWIHDDYRPLLSLRRLDPRVRVVIGPNLFVMPRDIPKPLYIPPGALYLHPSAWAVEAWRRAGFTACRLARWPVGVDLSELPLTPRLASRRVLVYFKRRDGDGLRRIEAMLGQWGFEHRVMTYGDYRQEEYVSALADSRFVVWYGCHEAQGLALQEALGMDRPIVVVDVAWLGDASQLPTDYQFAGDELDSPATTAPYFDERCGVVAGSLDELPAALQTMEMNISTWRPREFVEETLGLEACARSFLDLYASHWDGPPAFSVNEKYLPRFRPRPDWVRLPIGRSLRAWARRGWRRG